MPPGDNPAFPEAVVGNGHGLQKDTGRDAGRDARAVVIEDGSMTSEWYTLRARQANDQLARRSPIWLED